MQDLFVTKEGIILHNPIRNEKLLIVTNSEIDKVEIKVVEGDCDPKLFLKRIPFIQVYGIIRLKKEYYIIIVTESIFVGQLFGNEVYAVKQVNLVPISATIPKEDLPFQVLIQNFFVNFHVYYSPTYALTLSPEKNLTREYKEARGDISSEFCVNEPLVTHFVKTGSQRVARWVIPFIFGYFESSKIDGLGEDVEFSLLSRRSRYNPGVRFLARGADLDGRAANFTETEQIIISKQDNSHRILFHTQLKGSVPVKWTQFPDFSFNPRMIISGILEENSEIARRHFERIKTTFPEVFIVNLINRKGSQEKLGNEYKRVVEEMKVFTLFRGCSGEICNYNIESAD